MKNDAYLRGLQFPYNETTTHVIGLKKMIPFVKVLVSKHPSCRNTPPKYVHTNVEYFVEIMHIDFRIKKYHLKDDIS